MGLGRRESLPDAYRERMGIHEYFAVGQGIGIGSGFVFDCGRIRFE
jgi:hypothetical protein